MTDRVASSRASSSGLSVGCTAVVCGLRAASKPARCYAPVFHQSQHRQQTSVATCAYAASPSLGLPNMSSPPRQSLDPMAAAWEQDWEPGRLLTVKSPEQFAALHSDHPDKLIVLMCKSHACRPCKMFTRKYLSVVSATPVVLGFIHAVQLASVSSTWCCQQCQDRAAEPIPPCMHSCVIHVLVLTKLARPTKLSWGLVAQSKPIVCFAATWSRSHSPNRVHGRCCAGPALPRLHFG